ncbi:MAG: CRISPR-associated protein Csx15, partial [Anaerolineae bacterium]
MIVLNFAHPITPDHIRQIEVLTGEEVERVIEVNSQIDPQQPLLPQIVAMADAAGLSPAEWQTLP